MEVNNNGAATGCVPDVPGLVRHSARHSALVRATSADHELDTTRSFEARGATASSDHANHNDVDTHIDTRSLMDTPTDGVTILQPQQQQQQQQQQLLPQNMPQTMSTVTANVTGQATNDVILTGTTSVLEHNQCCDNNDVAARTQVRDGSSSSSHDDANGSQYQPARADTRCHITPTIDTPSCADVTVTSTDDQQPVIIATQEYTQNAANCAQCDVEASENRATSENVSNLVNSMSKICDSRLLENHTETDATAASAGTVQPAPRFVNTLSIKLSDDTACNEGVSITVDKQSLTSSAEKSPARVGIPLILEPCASPVPHMQADVALTAC